MGEIRVADINGVLSITTTAGVIHDVFKGKIRDMGLIRDND